MIRFVRYVLLALLGVALLTVALANRAPVTLRLLPDDLAALLGIAVQLQVPLFLVIFGGIMVGLLIGFLWEWLREAKHRSAAKGKTREVSKLERELAVLRDTKGQPADDVIALLDRPRTGG